MKVFLSYPSELKAMAEPIAVSLESRGHDVFFDRTDLPPGEQYEQQIETAIEQSDYFVFLISPSAVEEGRFTRTELKFVQQKWPVPSGRVLPVMAESTSFDDIPAYLKSLTVFEAQGSLTAEVSAAVDDALEKLGGAGGEDPKPRPIHETRELLADLVRPLFGLGLGFVAVLVSAVYPAQTTLGFADWKIVFCIGLSVIGLALVWLMLGSRNAPRWRWGAVFVALLFTAAITHKALDARGGTEGSGYLIGEIQGGFHPNTNFIELAGAQGPLMGAWSSRDRITYRFQLAKVDLEKTNCLSIGITYSKSDSNAGSSSGDAADAESGRSTENDDKDLDTTLRIHKRRLYEYFDGEDKDLNLYYDVALDKDAIFDAEDLEEPIGTTKCRKSTAPPPLPPPVSETSVWGIFSRAWAQQPQDIARSVRNLRSKNVYARRRARDDLAESGPAALPVLMRELQRYPHVYRVKLGAAYVVAKMLENPKVDLKAVRTALQRSDVERLSRLIDDNDSTIRSNAGELVLQLKDPRSLTTLMAVLKRSRKPQAKLFAAEGIASAFSGAAKPDQDKLFADLKRIQPGLGKEERAALSPIFLERSAGAQVSEGWVYVGIFFGKGWDELFFDINGDTYPGVPRKDDVLTARASVHLRAGPVRYEKGKGWVNEAVKGVIRKGHRLSVLDVTNIASGSYWARVKSLP